jgi:hypothetical protein
LDVGPHHPDRLYLEWKSRRARKPLVPDQFTWAHYSNLAERYRSTGDALQDTVQAVRRCGLSYAFGQKWFDVDTPEGLRQLTEHYT